MVGCSWQPPRSLPLVPVLVSRFPAQVANPWVTVKPNQLNLLLVLLELYQSLDQSADRNHSSRWENFYFCLLQRSPNKVLPSREGVSWDPFPPQGFFLL